MANHHHKRHPGWLFLQVVLLVSLSVVGCRSSNERDAANELLREPPLELPDDLVVEEYPLEPKISLEPLQFYPLNGSMESLLDWRAAWRQDLFPDNTFFEGSNYSMQAMLGSGTLVASQSFDQVGEGWITVKLDGDEIYRIGTGSTTPMNSLRGLWVVDESWVLEIALLTMVRVEPGNAVTPQAVGQIIQDGVLLNEKLGYQDMFGFQLMAGRPFYFFKEDNLIGFSYNEQAVQAGYTDIPHYACCSESEMNPVSAKNMVAFFAKRADTLYYVEIGVYYPR